MSGHWSKMFLKIMPSRTSHSTWYGWAWLIFLPPWSEKSIELIQFLFVGDPQIGFHGAEDNGSSGKLFVTTWASSLRSTSSKPLSCNCVAEIKFPSNNETWKLAINSQRQIRKKRNADQRMQMKNMPLSTSSVGVPTKVNQFRSFK